MAMFVGAGMFAMFRRAEDSVVDDRWSSWMPALICLLAAGLVGLALSTMAFYLLACRNADQVRKLQSSLLETMAARRGLAVPYCVRCRRVRSGSGVDKDPPTPWKPLDQFVGEQLDVVLSHGICPECLNRSPAAGSSPAASDRGPAG